MNIDNVSAVAPFPLYREMFRSWLDRRQNILDEERARREMAKEAWWEPKRRATSDARRIRDRDAKRKKRGKSAATVRQYVDCSKMTAEEKTAHRRKVEREKKQRQRLQARASAPYATNPAYGSF